MFLKVVVFAAFVALARATYLEPSLRIGSPVHSISYAAAEPLVRIATSPAVTKTEFVPGSYSSSYRSGVITPRVRYTETPGVSFTIAEPSFGFVPSIAKVEHVAPVLAKSEVLTSAVHTAPVSHTTLIGPSLRVASHGALAAPLPVARTIALASHF